MRLFIAIDVPDSIKEHLSFLQRSIEDKHLRLVHPKNIHLTLNFLGDEGSIEEIIKKLHSIPFESFTLRLGKMGFFPDKYSPHVIWVGLDSSPALSKLQHAEYPAKTEFPATEH